MKEKKGGRADLLNHGSHDLRAKDLLHRADHDGAELLVIVSK